MIKTAIICPHYPPEICGVGDYSYHLANTYVEKKHTVKVWTAQQEAIKSKNVSLRIINYPWSLVKFLQIFIELLSFKPQQIIVQYTPYIFAPKLRGINFFLPLFFLCLRIRFKKNLLINVHEANYPPGFSLKGLLIGLPHFIQFYLIAIICPKITFSHEYTCLFWRKALLWKWRKITWLPVGSNILYPNKDTQAPNSKRFQQTKYKLVYFGGAHPTVLFPYIFEALRLSIKIYGKENVVLFCVGIAPETLKNKLKESHSIELLENIETTGIQSAEAVSQWLIHCDLLLDPFLDGASTRRGTLMAAFAHGCNIVSTHGWASSSKIPWDAICYTTAAENSALAYAQLVIELLSKKEQISNRKKFVREYSLKHFDWPIIAEKTQKIIAAQ